MSLLRVLRRRLRGSQGERGNAIVEFIGLGIIGMVPIVYLVVTVLTLQRNVFAVTQAAREAGRVVATADTASDAEARAQYAVDLALRDQGLAAGTARISYTAATAPCRPDAPSGSATVQAGQDFAVCVTRRLSLPGVPGFLVGRDNTVTGRFVVRTDRFRG